MPSKRIAVDRKQPLLADRPALLTVPVILNAAYAKSCLRIFSSVNLLVPRAWTTAAGPEAQAIEKNKHRRNTISSYVRVYAMQHSSHLVK